MPIFNSGATLTGSSSADILVGSASTISNSVSGSVGDDLVLADLGNHVIASQTGATAAAALNMTSLTSVWSTAEYDDIFNSSGTPHATAVMEGEGTVEWMRFDLAAGQTLVIDVDYGFGTVGGGDTATEAVLFASDGTTEVRSSFGSSTLGGTGSTGADAYLSYTATASGTFYVRLSGEDGAAIATGANYLVNMTLTGQTTGSAVPSGNDIIDGGTGNDVMFGGGGADSFFGDAGRDTMFGGAGNDIMQGDLDKDTSYGGSGNDTFRVWGATFLDNVDGGGDFDTLDLSQHGWTGGIDVDLDLRDAVLIGNTSGADGEMFVRNIESVIGTEFADYLGGDEARNTLSGGSSGDTIVGGAGDDVLTGGAGNDTTTGGLGNDVHNIDAANDVIVEAASQGTGDRAVTSVSYTLGSGVSVEFLETSNEAGTGAINLTGNALTQIITGNAGANTISDGGGGEDILRGRGGNDTYTVGSSDTRVVEAVSGGGTDTVSASVDHTLKRGQFIEVLQTTLATGTGVIDLTGNNKAQTVIGNDGANRLNGGLDADTLTGRSGSDVFVFNTTLGSGNTDEITDFNVAADTIELDRSIFKNLALGTPIADVVQVSDTNTAANRDIRIIYNEDTGALFYDSNGSGAGKRWQFATLDDDLLLTRSDFLVVA